MSDSRFVIAGVSSAVQPRLEINTFIQDDRQFSLYVQSLEMMYSKSQDDVDSFFQVGGIHGLPYTTWNDATGLKDLDVNSQWGGYCTHGSALFPTWHRPYVMLYEQILHNHAQQIAQTYPTDTQAWIDAATKFRQPYWDWARDSTPPPEVISLDQVNIITPTSNGRKTRVDNPLRRYKFHPIHESFPSPYSEWETTLRHPVSEDRNTEDDTDRLQRALSRAQRSITSATFNMLTRVKTWAAFSSHTVGDGGSSSNSIEAIHDNIHVLVGGNGHMADAAVAAFDPIFYLHHCNVDRMLSLWSAINPNVWITSGDAEDGTFTLQAEEPVDESTSLTPFWDSQSSFWTSSNLKQTSPLGYTYPEFIGLDMSNSTAVRNSILNQVNNLYGSGSRSGGGSGGRTRSLKPTGTKAQSTTRSVSTTRSINVPSTSDSNTKGTGTITSRSTSPHPIPSPSPSRKPRLRDWTAHVTFKKYELTTSFSVLLFLGQVPENPNDWLISENMVGAHHAFVNSAASLGRCKNCQKNRHREMRDEGFVGLNDGILEFIRKQREGDEEGELDPSVVEPYLKENLKWRVQKVDGTPVDLKSLEITVLEVPLSLPSTGVNTNIPVPGNTRKYGGITAGKKGGYRGA